MAHAKTAAIITGSIDLTSIDPAKIKEKNGKKFLNITIKVQDQSKYGNNCWVHHSQSKEEQDNKVKAITLGNMAVKWLNPDVPITKAERNEVLNTQQNEQREWYN